MEWVDMDLAVGKPYSVADIRIASAVLVLSFFNFVQAAIADVNLELPRVVVDSGGPYESRSLSVQRFTGKIEIPSEYLLQPLSMVCTNGSLKAPGFSWVRMILVPSKSDQDYQSLSEPIGRMIVNEDSFLDSAQIYLDESRQFKPGVNQIVIEAAGRVGAVFSWEIRSIGKPSLSMPDQISTVGGGWLTIEGSGFSMRPDENIVSIGPARLPVGESNFYSLNVFVPKDFPPGNYDLTVAIRNYKSRSIKVQVIAPQKH